MIKKTGILILALLLLPMLASAQANMSLRTSLLLDRYEQQQKAQPSLKRAAAPDAGRIVGVMLTVDPTFDVQKLEELGMNVGVNINGVVTTRANMQQLAQLSQIKGIQHISADNRVKKKLDIAVTQAQGDLVHQGAGGLPQAYTGKGVVVGVVDFGFDLTHPTFFDAQNKFRIVRVWNQSDLSGGISGTKYEDTTSIKSKRYTSSESHGTHVAGIAAGSGGSTIYRGMAPNAELVLVQLGYGTDTEILEGIQYVFDYAQSVGKPAVVNLSLGSHYGPHDGTSSFDRTLDGLVGPGKIVVGAASNEGDIKLHAGYTFYKSNTTVRTVVGVPNTTYSTAQPTASAMAWAKKGIQVKWTVELWDAKTNKRLQQVNNGSMYSTAKGSGAEVKEKVFIANKDKDTVIVSAGGYGGDGSNSRGIVDIDVRNTNPNKYAVVLAIHAPSGSSVHMWNLGNEDSNAEFSKLNDDTNIWIDGNTDYTIGEIGGTSPKIVTVGAYTSKKRFTNLGGDVWSSYSSFLGEMADFSSKGPTTDGRIKPDIIAAGSMVASSVNSYDSEYSSLSGYVVARENKNGRSYYYGVMQGTSMAAPMVTGAVALLLEKRPKLTPDSVRCILQQNALLDSAIKSLPQNTRGLGKLDILQAMLNDRVEIYPPLAASILPWSKTTQQVNFKVIPNPSIGVFRVETEEVGKLTLRVYSIMGQMVYSAVVQSGVEVQLRHLPQGAYIVQLDNGKSKGVKKLAIINE